MYVADDKVTIIVRKHSFIMSVKNSSQYIKWCNCKEDNFFYAWSFESLRDLNAKIILRVLAEAEGDLSCYCNFGIVTPEGVLVGNSWLSYKHPIAIFKLGKV